MIIRPANSSDALTWYRWYHDKRMSHFFRGFLMGASVDDCADITRLLKAHVIMGFDEETGKPIGAMNFADTDYLLRIYRTGLLIDPEFQHKGLGKELGDKCLEWAFNTMNAHKLFCEILAEDERLITGVKYMGFREEGFKRESCFFDGKVRSEVLLSILKTDWSNNNAE